MTGERPVTVDRAALPLLPPPGSEARVLAYICCGAFPIAFGLLALFLGQDANWDLRNYHWYNAYAFLHGRFGFDLLPSQLPFFYNPLLDVPFYLLAANLPAKVATFILAAVQGLNFILLYLLAHGTLRIVHPTHRTLVAALLAAMGMLGAGGIAQAGTTFYDNITSLGILLSALLVVRSYPLLLTTGLTASFRLACLFGIPAGLMMGCKLPAVIFCVGLCGGLLLTAGPVRRRFWLATGFGIGILAGLAISLGHWAVYLQEQYGSPLFPYFNNLFQSPLAPATSARDMQFLPATWNDRLFFPFLFAHNPLRVGEIPWRDLRLPLLYALLPLCLAMRGMAGRFIVATDPVTAPLATRYLLWFATISYAAWLFLFAIYRYILSLEMLAPLLLVMILGFLPVRSFPRMVLTGGVLLVIAATLVPGNWGRRLPWMDRMVRIERPLLAPDSGVMMLMAGFEPYAHVVSEFPAEIPFVRIQSNFTGPDGDMGINLPIRKRVEGHNGPYMLLIPADQLAYGREALAHFGLQLAPAACQSVLDHLTNSRLALCDLERKHPLIAKP